MPSIFLCVVLLAVVFLRVHAGSTDGVGSGIHIVGPRRILAGSRNAMAWNSRHSAAAARWWTDADHRAETLHGWLRSIPAFTKQPRKITNENNHLENDDNNNLVVTEVAAVKTKQQQNQYRQHNEVLTKFAQVLPKADFFFDITPQTYLSTKKSSSLSAPPKKKRIDLREGMVEALEELHRLREEMEAMRKEIAALKMLQMGVEEETGQIPSEEDPELARQRRQRLREFEKLGAEVERWAEQILFPSASSQSNNKDAEETGNDEDGWTEIFCNKMLANKLNRFGQTRTYLKWMKDSRGKKYITQLRPPDDFEWPCLRMYTTIDAPVDIVCLYLSQENHVAEYNSLIEKHQDLEVITPHSKICWGQTPQVLFIKPKDFVSFCYHRWRRDGTQVIVNQACDRYGDVTANAFAFRGCTMVGSDPDDPDKTRIAMLTHASPGQDVPMWATKTALQSLLPIEPFRLFHRINQAVQQNRQDLESQCQAKLYYSTDMVKHDRVSKRPAGMAQLGFACFWPDGGGIQEGSELISSNDDAHGNMDRENKIGSEALATGVSMFADE